MRSTQCTRLSAPKWMLTRLWLQCRQRRIRIFAALNRPFAEWREVFPNAACVVSLVDRLVQRADQCSRQRRGTRS